MADVGPDGCECGYMAAVQIRVVGFETVLVADNFTMGGRGVLRQGPCGAFGVAHGDGVGTASGDDATEFGTFVAANVLKS